MNYREKQSPTLAQREAGMFERMWDFPFGRFMCREICALSGIATMDDGSGFSLLNPASHRNYPRVNVAYIISVLPERRRTSQHLEALAGELQPKFVPDAMVKMGREWKRQKTSSNIFRRTCAARFSVTKMVVLCMNFSSTQFLFLLLSFFLTDEPDDDDTHTPSWLLPNYNIMHFFWFIHFL